MEGRKINRKLTPPKKPKLRNYDDYISDMKAQAKETSDKLFNSKDGVRFLYDLAKRDGANLYGVKPIKKDRRKICNRIEKKLISNAEISYSKHISSGGYDNS